MSLKTKFFKNLENLKNFPSKKRLFGLLVFFTALFSTGVVAENGEGIRGTLVKSLGWLGEIDLTRIGVDAESTFWAKVLMWFTVFAIFYFAGTKTIFQDQKKIAGVLAAIIGMFVIFIPAEIFKQLFQTYQIIFLVVMYGIPLGAMFLAMHSLKGWVHEDNPKTYHVMGFILTLLIMFVMAQLENTLVFFTGIEGLFQFRDWIAFAYAFLHIYLIYHLIFIFVAKKEGEEEDTIAVKGAKKASDWAKKLRAFWRPEYKAGRKLKRVTKKMERASKTIIEALEAIMSGLEGLKENPDSKEARKTIIESINKIIPAIREEVAAKENFETLKARLEEWKTGQIKLAEDIKAALEMLRKDIEAKLAEGDLVDERRKELEDIMAESNWDIEVIDTELKLLEGEIIDFSKVEKIIEVIEGILPITVANLKQIEEHVKEGEYNEAYVLTKETLKNEKVIEKDFKIVMDTIKEIRVLISAERKQLRRIRKEIEKKLPKIKEKMGTSAEKYRKVAGAS